MTFELGHLFFVGVMYLLVLFLIAYATEQGWIPSRVARHPITYALSLGVYATSWTFYGSVGFAQSSGYNFLSIYLGVTLAFLLAPLLLSPLLRIVRDYQLTSLADLFAFRYQSQSLGVLVTLFMLAGTFPYIALQILAVTESVSLLTQEAPPRVLALGFCVTLSLFAVLFGARHITVREKHEGLVVAIAFESVVKLVALCAVGLFALFGVFGGPDGLQSWLDVNPEALERLYTPVREGPWTTLLLLSFAAAFLLPRQFHMTFTEALDERSLLAASWAFPLFLLLLNLFIPVILWAGAVTNPGTPADFYVLGITLSGADRLLPFVAFIGGLSAASAMMIVTSLALAAMCLNHLVLPLSTYPDPGVNLYRWVLWGRRTLIVVIIIAGYGCYLVLERNQGLVQLGLISFVAVLQFLPGVFGVLFWPRATRAGVIAGLLGGIAVWTLTLLLPLLERSGIIPAAPAWTAFSAVPGVDKWSLATFASITVNSALFFGVSLVSDRSRAETQAAEACRATSFAFPGGVVVGVSSPAQFEEQLARILGPQAAAAEVRQALVDLGLSVEEQDPGQLRRLRERIERNLSGLLGPMLSRMIVDERLQTDSSARTALADNIRLIEERLGQSQTRLDGVAAELDQLRRYHQQVLHDLPLGACAVDASRRVATWNAVMERLSGIVRGDAQGEFLDRLNAPWGPLLCECLDSSEEHMHKLQARVDGRTRWFNLHKAAIADGDAPVGGTVILVEDLTDLHNLEGELAHAERLASIGRLAAGVAHEIGNPVTGIACIAQNLQSETRDEEALEASRSIVEQTRRISDIVQSLVSFSHGGHLALGTFSTMSLRDCVDEAVRLVRLSRAAKEAELVNECSPEIEIDADRPRVVQVLVNLLTNAIDASPLRSRVLIDSEARNGTALFRVRDRGEGIDDEVMAKIFEPFVTTKPPGQGTGLGLAVVYRIVKDHGGSIELESERGRGTTVTVGLPLACAPHREAAGS
jgi:Na+/proline symporter/signal transduction histidine kinase